MRRTDSLKPTDSYYYNLGYDIYGAVIYEFCKWIHKRKRNEKLLFLAREGELLERCYRIIYPEEKTGILYASREVVTKGVAYTILEHESFEKFLEDVSVWRNETVVALLNRLGLNKDEVIRKIRDDGINLNDTINKNVIFYLNKNKTYFMDILVRYAAPFDKYIESVLEEENLVIDVGWTGSMQTLIAKYLKLKKSNKSVYGLYLGINNKINRDGFLFDNKNKLFHQVMNFSGLIEILFMPNHGTTIGYKTNGNQVEPIMAKSEFSDVSMQHITSFQTGVCSFVEKASNIGASFETNKCINKMVDLGCNPCKKDIYMMGNIEFFDNGNTYRLVEKDNIFHFKSFISKFIDCRWKTAFLKRNLHINLPYSDMVIVMRKISDRQISKKQR
jgi:predicted HAD superfamily hydrolase